MPDPRVNGSSMRTDDDERCGVRYITWVVSTHTSDMPAAWTGTVCRANGLTTHARKKGAA
jgi:hypothetical protein